MALQSSGSISIKNVQDEFSPTGGTGGAGIKFSEYYRNGSIIANDLVGGSIPNSGNPISLSQFYGAMDYSVVTISGGNRTNSNLRSLANSHGYNGTNPVRITINAGYHISTSTGNYGMRTGSFPSELKVDNYAFIMGKGGRGGNASGGNGAGGGHALLLQTNVTRWNNLGNGTCSAGGGGGGSGRYRDDTGGRSAAGGGGGAGGGNGGLARANHATTAGGTGSNSPGGRGADGGKRDSQAGAAETNVVRGRGGTAGGGGGAWGRDVNKGGNTSTSTAGSGGGGGRAYPGNGGAGGSNPDFANPGGSGGRATGGGGSVNTIAPGGGGGGWGASGGRAGGGNGGGGGRAIHRNGRSISHNNRRMHGSIAG